MGKLTEAKVRTAKPEDRNRFLNDGDGLYLRVRKSGTRTFIIRRKRSGKTCRRSAGQPVRDREVWQLAPVRP